ncbi:TIGR04282 family arsenosugar biosynthesis glycosyltransferase [Cecembia calidifontis]|uniref:Glycosyltransferase A (GT-A) superfamily protein (DUF2064 family) n=1 Tax=Cecembia calidifontis TaxID=1187080 RepID=A0A4Q7PCT2_9BACT|nr:TIGR04282 family arsenosugar biosynthesis glycosyltransferase [Cecembia calidifontis]RZS98144.1 hypothetical protein BC751_3780 [Cecembia calidifontis]
MNSQNIAIIVFQKNLVLGRVKTRIAQQLGNEKALEIYRVLVQKTHEQLAQLTDWDVFLYYSDFLEAVGWKPKEGKISYRLQKGEDLGAKMRVAFDEVFLEGYQKVLIIGTDCPEITAKILNEAAAELEHHDVVFGPAMDGGYYLLGMKKTQDGLFQNIPWSTDSVLEISIQYLKQNQISFQTIRTLTDIDTAEDWEKYKKSTLFYDERNCC